MPDSEKLSSTYHNENTSVSIHWEMDKNGYIKRLACNYNKDNPWQGQLDIITKQAEGNTIDKILSLLLQREDADVDPIIDLPFMLLRKSLLKYKGIPCGHSNILKKQADTLVCRCFGVYGKSIENLIWQKPGASLKNVTDQLKAAGGCTRCSSDIKKMLISANLTPVQLAYTIDKLKNQWIKQNNQKDIQMEILEIKKNKIIFFIRPEQHANSLLKSLQGFLDFHSPGLHLSSREPCTT